MALIPGGSFQMGSDQIDQRPVHTVNLNEFFIDKYEVTNADYAKCVAAKKCSPPASNSSRIIPADYFTQRQYATYPVLFVSWDDALAYCTWRGARLPSEAEWEKAARGGLEGKQYPWGDSAPGCTPGATNGAQLTTCRVQGSVAVGSFAPNGYGLFDMAGNAWEWVNDWYNKSYYNAPPGNNPSGPAEGDPPGNPSKIVRGGGWSDESVNDARVANFSVVTRTGSRDHVGFRCVATVR
jgi:formylglycine-generating enzyme required for sulfatase activity